MREKKTIVIKGFWVMESLECTLLFSQLFGKPEQLYKQGYETVRVDKVMFDKHFVYIEGAKYIPAEVKLK